jgi:hypothetical protein
LAENSPPIYPVWSENSTIAFLPAIAGLSGVRVRLRVGLRQTDRFCPVSDMAVYHSRLRWQPTLASVGRRLATRPELLRDNF